MLHRPGQDAGRHGTDGKPESTLDRTLIHHLDRNAKNRGRPVRPRPAFEINDHGNVRNSSFHSQI